MNSIKKSHLILALISLSVFGCGDGDDNDPDNIIGTWNAVDVVFDLRLQGQTIAEWFVNEVGLSEAQSQGAGQAFEQSFGDNFLGSFTFNADGTCTSSGNRQPASGTWEFDGETLRITPDETGEEIVSFRVSILNSENLVLEFTQNVLEDLDGNGVEEELQATIDWSFNRQL